MKSLILILGLFAVASASSQTVMNIGGLVLVRDTTVHTAEVYRDSLGNQYSRLAPVRYGPDGTMTDVFGNTVFVVPVEDLAPERLSATCDGINAALLKRAFDVLNLKRRKQ